METNTNAGQEPQIGNEGAENVQGTQEGKEQKLFTQEEVNGFVQSRLTRYRGQTEKEVRKEYDQKLQELQAREMRLLVKERLHDRDMPRELADIITCTDEDDLDSKLDALQKIYGGKGPARTEQPTGFRIGAPGNGHPLTGPDPVREAMGLNRKE